MARTSGDSLTMRTLVCTTMYQVSKPRLDHTWRTWAGSNVGLRIISLCTVAFYVTDTHEQAQLSRVCKVGGDTIGTAHMRE